MAYDGIVKIGTELDKKGLESGLSSLGSFAQKGFGVLGSAASAAAKLAAEAIVGVSAALGAGATAVLNVGMSFEEGMSKVSAISGATGEDLDALTEKAKEMGAKTKFSATESAAAMEYMAMAGWETADMLNGIEGIMNLAAASGEDLATTSDIVTDAMTAFGMAADETTTVIKDGYSKEVANATHFADVLAQASASANTNVSMLGESFKYAAPVAGALGYSAEDTAFALGLMANAGIKASQGGTALRTMLTNMAKPTDTMAAAMGALGVSLDDGNGNMLSLLDVMKELRSGFGELMIPQEEFTAQLAELDQQLADGTLTQKKYDKALKELTSRAYGAEGAEKARYAAMLAGQEGMSGLLAIVNASEEDFAELEKSIYNCDGAATGMAETMQDNLQGQIVILQSALEGLGIEIYQSVQEPLKDLVIIAQESVNELTEAFKSGGTEGLIEAGAKLASDLLLGVANALPDIVSTAAQIIQSIVENLGANLPQVIEAGASILMSLAKGIVSVIGSIGILAIDIITALVTGLIQNGPQLWQQGSQMLGQFLSGITSRFPEIIQNGGQTVSQFLSGISVHLPDILQTGSKMLVNLLAGLLQKAPQVISQAKEMTTGWLEEILGMLPAIVDCGGEMIVSLLSALLENAPDIITQAVEMLSGWTGAILDSLPSILKSGKNIILELLKALVDNAPDIIAQAGKMLVDYGYEIASHFPELLQTGIEIILQILEGLVRGAAQLIGSIPGILSDIGSAFLEKDWGSVGSNIIEGIKNGVRNAAGGLVDAAVSAARNAIERVKGWLGIHSPSKRARDEIGVNMIAGIGEGIEEETPQLEQTSEESAKKAVNSMKQMTASEFVGSIQAGSYRRAADNEMAARKKFENNGYDPEDPDGGDGEITIINEFNVDGKKLVDDTVKRTKKEIAKEQRNRSTVKGDVCYG